MYETLHSEMAAHFQKVTETGPPTIHVTCVLCGGVGGGASIKYVAIRALHCCLFKISDTK